MPTRSVTFLGLNFDNLPLQEVKARLARVTPNSPYSYIATPNVDHMVKLDRQPRLRAIYDDSVLCVCDSRILALLARLQGKRLAVVPGSDLTEALFADVIKPGDRIAVVGGDEQLIDRLRLRYAAIDFTHHIPPMGLSRDETARRAAAAFVAESNARFIILAVGSPQQEFIARQALSMSPSGGVALCVGASLDFLTGRQQRAPRVMRRLGLEWAHRLMTNPRRLWRRYLVDGMAIFPIFARHAKVATGGCALAALLFVALTVGTIYTLFARDWAQDPATSEIERSNPAAAAAALSLPAPDLLRPLSPEEAAERNAERPFVTRSDQAAAGFLLSMAQPNGVRAETCLTQAIYYEAAGEGVDGGRAVAQVVLNRVRHPAYPASVCGVVFQGSERVTGCQFSFTCDGSMRRVPSVSGWARARTLAREALSGGVFAPVGHSTHFHADYVLPYWADSLDKTAQIGRHIFYRLRGSLGAARTFAQRYAGSEPDVAIKPETPLVIASSEADQLVDDLIADDIARDMQGQLISPKPNLIAPNSALEVDRLQGTLISDVGREAAGPKAPKAQKTCDDPVDDRKLRPMRADTLATGSAGNC